MTAAPRVALVTYTTRPRGGPVHTVELAEALGGLGCPVHVFALGDPAAGFFRPLSVPHTIFPAPGSDGSLEDRVFAAVDALATGLARALPGRFDVVHVQDCIASTAAVRLREAGGLGVLVRTVHHLDDFTTSALVNCQHRSVVEPDHLLVVRVSHEQHGAAVGRVAPHGRVHAGDERTDRIDRPQPPHCRPLVHGGLDAVGGEHDQGACGRIVLGLDEDGAAPLELAHDVGVVDDLAADVDGGTVQLQCSLDGLHGSLDARAVSAGRRQKQPRYHER